MQDDVLQDFPAISASLNFLAVPRDSTVSPSRVVWSCTWSKPQFRLIVRTRPPIQDLSARFVSENAKNLHEVLDVGVTYITEFIYFEGSIPSSKYIVTLSGALILPVRFVKIGCASGPNSSSILNSSSIGSWPSFTGVMTYGAAVFRSPCSSTSMSSFSISSYQLRQSTSSYWTSLLSKSEHTLYISKADTVSLMINQPRHRGGQIWHVKHQSHAQLGHQTCKEDPACKRVQTCCDHHQGHWVRSCCCLWMQLVKHPARPTRCPCWSTSTSIITCLRKLQQ